MEIGGDEAGVIRQECQHEEFGFFLKAMGVMKRHKQVKDTVRSEYYKDPSGGYCKGRLQETRL